jgi:hypothetical protein
VHEGGVGRVDEPLRGSGEARAAELLGSGRGTTNRSLGGRDDPIWKSSPNSLVEPLTAVAMRD